MARLKYDGNEYLHFCNYTKQQNTAQFHNYTTGHNHGTA